MNKKTDSSKTNYGKIIAITLAVIASACAIIFALSKLVEKFFSFKSCTTTKSLEGLGGESCDDENCEICHPRKEDDEEADA